MPSHLKTEMLPPGLWKRNPKQVRIAGIKKIGQSTHIAIKKQATVKRAFTSKTSLKLHDPKSKIATLEKYMGPAMEKKFGDQYRGFWPDQDELLRTSFVTHLLMDLQARGVNAADLAKLKVVIDSFSSVRFPTRWSGFNFNDGRVIAGNVAMQHPTSPGTGIWLPSVYRFSGAHTAMDEAREKHGIDTFLAQTMVDAHGQTVLKSGITLEKAVKATLVAVGTFTLRFFTAPAAAGNVKATASTAVKEAQTRSREFLKDQLESIGANRQPSGLPVPPLNLSLVRNWEPETLSVNEISPRRGAAVNEIQAAADWGAV